MAKAGEKSRRVTLVRQAGDAAIQRDVRSPATDPSQLTRAELELELERLRAERDAIAGALDAIPQPVILVDAESRVTGLNAAARRFLSPQNCDACGGCTLYTSHSSTTASLHEAVTAIAADHRSAEGAAKRRTLTVSCPNGRARLDLNVGSLARADAKHPGGAVAAVVVGGRTQDLEHGNRALFCLTPAEARVARCVAHGLSLKEAAAEIGVSIHTVRMQLRQVFAKTGTRRQADLLRLMLS